MKKRNFETKIITGLLTAGMILSLTACGSSSNGSYGISDLMDADYSVVSNEAAASEASAYEDGFGMTEGYDSAGNAQDTSTTVPEETAATADRKLIKTVNMDVETREYDKLLSAVENKVTELGGYIESLDAYNGSTYYSYRSTRNANLTIRIPKDRLEEFQNTVSELGNVTSRSENVQDVTLTYVDLQSYRDALQTEQERLLQLLEQAESIEDIITIEQRLSDVRYQLESMESQLRSYDNQVDYSTVYLYIDEVEVYTPVEEETTWERISAGFMDSLKSIGEGIKEAAIWFVIHIPYLVIWAIVIVIIVLKHGTKGFTSFSSILIGIIVGYILVSIMAMVLPTTFTYVDDTGATVEATKAWVLNWDKVAQAKWFAVPALMPIKWVFDARAIVPILIMFIVTAVETVGDISGITEGGLGREATDKELSGGVMCDGLGSSFAALFGVLPNTSFSQNVGLVAMNKVVNRFCIATGGIFLIACGLFPKLAALISIMPQSVLGGAAVMMFSSIVVSGIQLITKWPIGPRNVTIVSVALGLGYGLGSNTAILVHLPQAISLIFGGSGIVPAAVFAIILNIVLPKDEKSEIERAEEMLEKVKNK